MNSIKVSTHKINAQRNISLDILKCLSMLFVVLLHVGNDTKGYYQVVLNPPFDIKWLLDCFISTFAFVAVNCFVLITGYFLCESKIRYKKIINLWLTVFTYSFGFYVILCIVPFCNTHFSVAEIIKNAFPIIHKRYWFVTCYLLLYALVPFLNKLINVLSNNEFKLLLFILITFYVVLTTLFNDIVDSRNGYSLCWFIILYFTAAYIRKNPFPKLHYGWLYIITSLISFGLTIIIEFIDSSPFEFLTRDPRNYNSIFTFFSSVCLFLFFEQLDLKVTSKLSNIISRISIYSFGVYLFHEHQYLSPIIWHKIVGLYRFQNNTIKFFIVYFSSVILIYIIGILVEWLRTIVFKLFEPAIQKLTNTISSTVKRLLKYDYALDNRPNIQG